MFSSQKGLPYGRNSNIKGAGDPKSEEVKKLLLLRAIVIFSKKREKLGPRAEREIYHQLMVFFTSRWVFTIKDTDKLALIRILINQFHLVPSFPPGI